MIPFRCQLCGETYLGAEVPDRCPFCGALGAQLIHAALWIDYGKVDMSPESYRSCEQAVQLELSNAAFYKCCADQAENQVSASIFKRLHKQEAEHAELLCKMMGIEEPPLPLETCSDLDEENFRESHRREKRAMNFYLRVVKEAPEARLKDVFRALAEIENEHLQTSNLFG